ncbi:MAG: hypothetical protein AAF629_13120, partial [Chloroflexota bacterium]
MNSETRLTTHPQFRQIALSIYIGVLLIGLFDWFSGRPPSTLFPIEPSTRLIIFCGALLLLVGMELSRKSILSLQLPAQNVLYLFSSLTLSGIAISISSFSYTQLLFLISILFAELTFQRGLRVGTILITFG